MELSGIDKANGAALSGALDARLGAATDAAQDGRADQAAVAFEKLLATLLVREMSTSLEQGFFGDGPGADTFQGWLEEHLGDALSGGRGLGIAESVRASLLAKQAEAEPPAQAAEDAR